MAGVTDGVDRSQLSHFLDSAPPELAAWVEAQRAELGLDADLHADEVDEPDAVGIEVFEDEADEFGGGSDPASDTQRGSGEANPAAAVMSAADARQGASGAGSPPSGKTRNSKTVTKNLPEESSLTTASAIASKINLVLVVLLVAAVVIIVKQAGTSTNTNTSVQNPHANQTMSQMWKEPDQARVDELTAKVEQNPDDIESMSELGAIYYKAALYDDAIAWQERILEKDPNNIDALLALGVSQFDTNQLEQAEKNWMRVTELKPQAAEPWYNLGFLYLNKKPADYDKARAAWTKVIELEPDSELGQAAKSHLSAMVNQSADPSSTPSGR